jgi:low affinity Fe/Cu permease
MNRGGHGTVFDVLALVMLGLTMLACLCYSTVFFAPELAGPFAGPSRLSAALAPTATPTVGPLLPATWTPTPTSPPVDTPTPFVLSTEEPTEVRPTITLLPTRTKAPTPGPSPTVSVTPSKYRFTAEVTFQPAPIYAACGASIIAGTITDLEGKPVTASDMIIHVEGDADIDANMHPGEEFRGKKVQGRSPLTGMGLGPSAWDVVINLSGTAAGTWQVWLIQNGQASDRIQVQLQSDCADSSAVVRFQQNH